MPTISEWNGGYSSKPGVHNEGKTLIWILAKLRSLKEYHFLMRLFTHVLTSHRPRPNKDIDTKLTCFSKPLVWNANNLPLKHNLRSSKASLSFLTCAQPQVIWTASFSDKIFTNTCFKVSPEVRKKSRCSCGTLKIKRNIDHAFPRYSLFFCA